MSHKRNQLEGKNNNNSKSSPCEHGRRRSNCKDCGGSSICVRQKQNCPDCGGSSICVHRRQKVLVKNM